jgi:O-antigen/teichoic acid export membrane protein
MTGSNLRSIAKNTSIMFVQQIVTWASTFILMIFMPRFLGPVNYGRLFLASSISQIFGILVTYGGNFLIAKNVSRSRETTPQILIDEVSLRFFLGIVAFIGVVVLAYAIDYPREIKILLFIFSSGFLWGGGIVGLYAAYQGHELLKYTSAGAIVERVFHCVAGVTALLLGADAVILAVIIVSGNLLNFLILTAYSRKIISYLPPIRWNNLLFHLKSGLPYFAFAVFSTLYFRVGSVMLSKMAPESVVGWFGTAYRLFETMQFLPFIYSTALYPVLSRLWTVAGSEHDRMTQKSLGFMIMTGIPMSVGVILFAENIIHIFYGHTTYDPSIIVLQFLSVGLPVFYIDIIVGTMLLSSDKQKSMSFVSFFAIPVNIVFNFFLIPYYQTHYNNGGMGCAISTIGTEIFIMILFFKLMPKGFLRGFPWLLFLKCALAGVGMVAAYELTRFLGIHWTIQAILISLFYCTCVLLFKVLEKSEQIALIKLLKFNRTISNNSI